MKAAARGFSLIGNDCLETKFRLWLDLNMDLTTSTNSSLLSHIFTRMIFKVSIVIHDDWKRFQSVREYYNYIESAVPKNDF